MNGQVVVLEDLQTKTFTYQIGVTDLAITLCLEKDLRDNPRNPIFGVYYPRSLRVDEKAVEKSLEAEFVDFIFAKDIIPNGNNKYSEMASQINNLYVCGRLGNYKYYNMDQAIECALNLVSSIKDKNTTK